jgi:hypothetical protein
LPGHPPARGGLLVYAITSRTPPRSGLVYKDKPIEAWFYGDRTDFFTKDTEDTAKEAIRALGTNAFPFLLSTLEKNQGVPIVYFKFYRAMPHRLQTHLLYPIVSDDIRDVALFLMLEIRRLSPAARRPDKVSL